MRGSKAHTRRRTGRLQAIVAAVAVVAPLWTSAGPAAAAPGELDPTFGTDGKATGPQGGVTAMLQQADGKFVLGASVFLTAAPDADFRLARFTADGALDPTFGIQGVVDTDRTQIDSLSALAQQPDGKLLAGGYMFVQSADFAIARYLENGVLDPTFGVGGVAITNLGEGEATPADSILALDVQSDGKIVAAGWAERAGTQNDFAVARFNPDGTLDPTFGAGGKVVTDHNHGRADQMTDIEIVEGATPADRRIVAVGCGGPHPQGYHACTHHVLARYTDAGALDPSFGTGGMVAAPAGVADLVVQPDGKLLVAGSNGTTSPATVVLGRYSAAGAPDVDFGTAGVATGPPGYAWDVVVAGDGRIVVAGARSTPYSFGGPYDDFLVARFTRSGELDTGFGTGGVTATDFGKYGLEGAVGVAVQPDGRIVAGGTGSSADLVPTVQGAKYCFALARYSVARGAGR